MCEKIDISIKGLTFVVCDEESGPSIFVTNPAFEHDYEFLKKAIESNRLFGCCNSPDSLVWSYFPNRRDDKKDILQLLSHFEEKYPGYFSWSHRSMDEDKPYDEYNTCLSAKIKVPIFVSLIHELQLANPCYIDLKGTVSHYEEKSS